jgi:hypothetical protein
MTFASWKAAVDGRWISATHWRIGSVPGAIDDAIFDLTSGYTVLINSPITVGSIDVAKNQATLSVNVGSPNVFVADSGSSTDRSALTGLANDAGTLSLQDRASVSIGGNLLDTGGIGVDGYASDSGSRPWLRFGRAAWAAYTTRPTCAKARREFTFTLILAGVADN